MGVSGLPEGVGAHANMHTRGLCAVGAVLCRLDKATVTTHAARMWQAATAGSIPAYQHTSCKLFAAQLGYMCACACLATLDKDHVHGPHLHLAELSKIDEAAKNLANVHLTRGSGLSQIIQLLKNPCCCSTRCCFCKQFSQ